MRHPTADLDEPSHRLRPAADPYLLRIRDLLYQVAGIFQPEGKLSFFQACCERRMKAVQARSLREYFGVLTLDAEREAELRHLLQEITVGETRFFRNPSQLEALRKVVIPSIVRARSSFSSRRFRAWSAGCATGEEPYTLAMVLLEEGAGALAGWTVEVVATDWNAQSLVKAREGIYRNESLRDLPPQYKQKYFRAQDDRFRLCDEVKSCVSFHGLNLLDDSRLLFIKDLDVIFCSNVLIYYEGALKRRIVQHFYHNLLPPGYLFLGESESLFGLSGDFRLVHLPGATAYRKSIPAG